MYNYTCGRALGKITEPNKNTRFVIYNTNSSDDDYMDETYFDSIKNTIMGGKNKKTKNKKQKNKKQKNKKTKKQKNKKTKKWRWNWYKRKFCFK
jgi:hypothetical protein